MSNDEMASFGVRLRQLREAAGLTQEELAARAGLTRKGIGALEREERRRPYPHTVRALGMALGLDPAAMAEFIGAVPRQPISTGAATGRPDALPVPLTELVGREGELGAILAQVEAGARLVTLTGPGGVGKTRLAIEAGQRLGVARPGEVAFVPLAPLTDVALVPSAIAHAIGLRETADRGPQELIRSALRDRSMLLILDNAEHLLAAAPFLHDVLEGCPTLQLLVTSRAPLRIRGERELPVHPLALPERDHRFPSTADDGSPAMRLFILRAQAVAPDFAVTTETTASVAAICRRLEGLPLAIELAAPRIRLLSPDRLLAHLERLLPTLSGGSRDLPERQQTMHATIQWSYALLDEAERTLFRRLAPFGGGWTLEAAQAMAPDTEDVVPLLSGLVEHALVSANPAADRYRMLEPIREFAAEALAADPCGDEARWHHATWHLQLAEHAAPRLDGADQLACLERLDAEHDNLRDALRWLIDRADPDSDLAARLVAALARYWYLRGHWSEGRSWIDSVLTLRGSPQTPARAAALSEAGLIALFQNDYRQAHRYLRHALEAFRTHGNERGTVEALTRLGFVASFERDLEAVAAIRAEIDALAPPDPASSTSGYLRIFLGLDAVLRGDLATGIARHRESLTIFRALSHLHGMVWSMTNLGLLELITDQTEAADAVMRKNLPLATRLGEPASIHYALLGLATLATQRGHADHAARLWGHAEAVRVAAGMELSPLARAQTLYDTWVERARDALGDTRFASAWAEGRTMSLAQVTTLVEATATPASPHEMRR